MSDTENSNLKSAIVFGGSGFLGSHVADALSDSGFKVRIFDLRSSPYLKEGQELIIEDLMDQAKVTKAVEGCDVVYNFAGIADIKEAHGKPVETANVNVLGTVYTLEAARKEGVKRYVFASSVYVYSNQGSFYRTSKQSAERFIETYKEVFDLNYTILRYGSLYGRRADNTNMIFNWISQMLSEKIMVYPGNGNELREYIHVSDAAQLSVDILADKFANQHIILTGSEKMKVKDMMMMIAEIMGGGIKLKFSDEKIEGHYAITPYSFNPKIGKKLVNNYHTDLGQGLLDCLDEVYQKLQGEIRLEADWYIKNNQK